jgi:hypothetical protein
MSTPRGQAEDRLEMAEARRLAADDAFGLMQRLVTSGQANRAELAEADEALIAATREVQQAYREVAEIAELEIVESLKRKTGRPEVDFRVAVRFQCGWRESSDQAGCSRVAGRVVVVRDGGGEHQGSDDGEGADAGAWLWIPCGGDASSLEASRSPVAICSRHGERPLAPVVFDPAVEAARRHPSRWPIPR